MIREVRVLLVEDDFYARGWMEMLLRRDWRTRVVGEADQARGLAVLLQALRAGQTRVDLALIDTDILATGGRLSEMLEMVARQLPHAQVLLSGVRPNPGVVQVPGEGQFAGYVLKDEIRYALAWAVSLAMEGHFVLTPGVRDLLGPLPTGSLVLDGRNPVANFSKRDADAARLAFMFSMERRDLADELEISEEYSYGLVSSLYEKMGLNDILKSDASTEQYFGSHPAVQAHIRETIESLRGKEPGGMAHKIKDKETLAFHLLTLPEIEEAGSRLSA
jgi:DNA-binding NarL/FixJ family response regulator